MELQARPVEFSDLVAFMDCEVRIITNPASSGSGTSAASAKTSKLIKTSFLSQVDGAEVSPRSDLVSNCLYCNRNHTLEDCQSLRWKPYPERIQFLTSKNLCFGCLSDQHVSRNCPQRKTCKIANCTGKHPSILHTRQKLV